MTNLENAEIRRIDDDVRHLKDRMIAVETKLDDAQELREVARDQLSSMSNRMNWLLALVISMVAAVAVAGYQVNDLTTDVKANQEAITKQFKQVIEQQEPH